MSSKSVLGGVDSSNFSFLPQILRYSQWPTWRTVASSASKHTEIKNDGADLPVSVVSCVFTPAGCPPWMNFGRNGIRGFATEASSTVPYASQVSDSTLHSGVSEFSGGVSDSTCSFKTVVSTRCYMETGPGGAPTRRCETLRRKFRQCPGMPVEEVESSVEETTGEDLKPTLPDFPDSWPFSGGDHPGDQGRPLDGLMPGDLPAAKLFEDFFELAQRLQRDMGISEGEPRAPPCLLRVCPPARLSYAPRA